MNFNISFNDEAKFSWNEFQLLCKRIKKTFKNIEMLKKKINLME